MTEKRIGWIIAAVCLLIVIFLSITVVSPGYQGVVFSLNGGVKQKVLGQGLNFHMPFPLNRVTEYPVSTETVYMHKNTGDQFDVNTMDGKSVEVDVVYSYHMDSNQLAHIFTKFRRKTHDEIESTYIKTLIKTVMQETTTKYSVLGVYAEHRDEVTKLISKNLSAELGKDGIILENFSMSDVRPDGKTMKSLQAIADAQNKQEYLKREELNKKQEAVNNTIEAEGKKQVAIVEADGRSEANRKLQQSITPSLIQYEWVKRWDGKLPTVSGSSSIMQLPSSLLK